MAVKHKTPRRGSKKLNENLDATIEQLYQEPNGSLPDLSTIEHRKSRPGMWVTALILLFLGAATGAAWLGFFLFNPAEKFSENLVAIDIKTPDTMITGVPQTYVVTIRNDNDKPIASASLFLTYPAGFVATASVPAATSDKNEHWNLGAIDPSASKILNITGVYAPTELTTSTWQVALTFRPSNFNSDFDKNFSVEKSAPQAALQLTIKSESKAQDKISVELKNTSEFTFTNLLLVIDSGATFNVSSTSPKTKNSSSPWEFAIPELTSGNSLTFSVWGTLQGTLQAAAKAQLTLQGKTITAATANTKGMSTIPKTADLTITLTSNNKIVAPGEAIDLVLDIFNGTAEKISGVALVVQTDTPAVKNKSIFDYNHLGSAGDPDVVGKKISATRRGAFITWLPEKLNELGDIAPGAEFKITVHLDAKKLDALGSAPTETASTFQAVLKTSDNKTISSEPLKINWRAP